MRFQYQLPLLLCSLFLFTGCAVLTKRVKRTTDLPYVSETSPDFHQVRHRLDIYAPAKKEELKKVLLYIHGGSWNSGEKELYKFLGNRFARKGILTVVMNYRLSPTATAADMAWDAARAVKWVQEHIADYGGDPEQLFVAGHSAGGHLAALISLNETYFDRLEVQNPVKGAILIDAAGLDMYSYLQEKGFAEGHTYLETFTNDPQKWKETSPIYHLDENMPPLLIYRGGRTYPSIANSTERFVEELKAYVPEPNYKVQKRKKHVPMIVQFIFTLNPRYKEIRRFMENPEEQPFEQ